MKAHLLQPPDNPRLLTDHLIDGIEISMGDALPSGGVDVLIGGRVTEADLAASPNLRTIIIPWAGPPEPLINLVRAHPPLTLHNLHHNDITTAEMAVALLMSAAKFIPMQDHRLHQGDWTPRYQPSGSALVYGKTALILGYGAIGRHAGRMLTGMGSHVIGVKRTPSTGDAAPGVEIHPQGSLRLLLPRANFLIITAPLTLETRGLIGSTEMQLLPKGAILVNVGRGLIVDQAALYDALISGHLRAAGLDVWWNYPTDEASRTHTLPSNFPHHELPNLVMTPHRGGEIDEREPHRYAALAELLNAAARGEPIPNRVNLELGY